VSDHIPTNYTSGTIKKMCKCAYLPSSTEILAPEKKSQEKSEVDENGNEP
jgi:hypothetical protein